MLNIYEQIDANKRRSAIVIVGFTVFVIGFIWLVGQVFGSDPTLLSLAAIFSLASSATSYFWGDRIILGIVGAKQASREEYFDFYTVAENLSLAAQIPLPKLYVIQSPSMNAFATGRDPQHAIICATTGLLEKLERSELEGVIAHEVSHITNFDIRLMMIVAVLVGMIILLSDWLTKISWYRGENEKKREVHPLIMLIGAFLLVISPLIAKLIQLAVSRSREYLADASAVKLTRYPQGLISALEKLSADSMPLKTANPATAHLYIVNPFKGMKKGLHYSFATLFATHPPIEKRIAELKKML